MNTALGNMSKKKSNSSSSDIELIDSSRVDSLCRKVSNHIVRAREAVQHSVNIEMVKAYWLIGRDIVEEEQHGQKRAEYGRAVLRRLSSTLKKEHGRGFGVDTLERARKLFLLYQVDIREGKSAALRRNSEVFEFNPALSWTHYRTLIKISRPEARAFYEKEAAANSWSARELDRQVGSLLFDRLAKSKDKEGVLALACKGQEINSAKDAIKDPFVLEFLNIPESHMLVESKLEEALIMNLQQFLLELGKGFAFIARQKRLSFDGNHFYADLVFYHVILKCYVIIDLKTHALTHGDLGQMQLYVNYFDQEISLESDNPTIGLLLCTEKSDAMVKYQLGDKSSQIFASKYQFHLPTEEELEVELKREIKTIKHQLARKKDEE